MPRAKFSQPCTIGALELYNNRNELRIPSVQRELVWTTSQKQLLIDSLLKDFDIPKVYFRDVVENNRNIYYVIDGQQRLNAIFAFLKDEFAMPKDSDPVNGEEIKGKKWSEFSSDLQIEFKARSLDVVHLKDYSDDEIDETFLRLQNGTPLKAAEKRRAIPGEMRKVVAQLATDDFFEKVCGFSKEHFGFEDVTAKILKQIMEGQVGSISAQSLSRFYEINDNISITDNGPKNVKKAFNFVTKAFKKINPKLKKYAALDLCVIAESMLRVYDLKNYPDLFGKAYLDFEEIRALNKEKPEEEQDQKLLSYDNTTRADSVDSIQYRQNYLKEFLVAEMPYLRLKDDNRNFTQEQRIAIYRKSNGICAICGKPITQDEFEADHIEAWSNGGPTTIANGQALCDECNKRKSDN